MLGKPNRNHTNAQIHGNRLWKNLHIQPSYSAPNGCQPAYIIPVNTAGRERCCVQRPGLVRPAIRALSAPTGPRPSPPIDRRSRRRGFATRASSRTRDICRTTRRATLPTGPEWPHAASFNQVGDTPRASATLILGWYSNPRNRPPGERIQAQTRRPIRRRQIMAPGWKRRQVKSGSWPCPGPPIRTCTGSASALRATLGTPALGNGSDGSITVRCGTERSRRHPHRRAQS